MFFHGVAIKYMMMKMRTSVGSLAKGALDSVKGGAGKVGEIARKTGSKIGSAAKTAWDATKTGGGYLADVAKSSGSKIGSAAKTAWDATKTGGGYLLNAAKVGGSSLVGNAGKIASIGSKLSLAGIASYIGGEFLDDRAKAETAKGNIKTGAALDTAGYALQGGALGATIGSFVPVAGTAVGAAVGAGMGGAYGLYQNWTKSPTSPKLGDVPTDVQPGKIATPSQPLMSSALADKKADAISSLTSAAKTLPGANDGTSTSTKTPDEPSRDQSLVAIEQLTARVVQLLELMINKPESESQTKLTNEYMRNGSNLRIATAMYSQPVINVPS
jgi:hypothetical protein